MRIKGSGQSRGGKADFRCEFNKYLIQLIFPFLLHTLVLDNNRNQAKMDGWGCRVPVEESKAEMLSRPCTASVPRTFAFVVGLSTDPGPEVWQAESRKPPSSEGTRVGCGKLKKRLPLP